MDWAGVTRLYFSMMMVTLVCGCEPALQTPNQDPTTADDGVGNDGPTTGDAGAHEAEGLVRFTARQEIRCDPAETAVVQLTLHQGPACSDADSTPRLALRVNPGELDRQLEEGGLFNVAPETGVSGTYFDEEGEPQTIVAGHLRLEVFQPGFGTTGSLALLTSQSTRVEGRFRVPDCEDDPVELPECWPDAPAEELEGPDEPAACSGRYDIVSWMFERDLCAFNPGIVNDLFRTDIESGELRLSLHFDADAETLQVTDLVSIDGDEFVHDNRVPLHPAMDYIPGEHRRFSMVRPGLVSMYLSAADYPDAMPMVWTLYRFELSGHFTEDCSALTGTVMGAFANSDDFTIPGRPDVDIDRDGVADGFSIGGPVRAERTLDD